MRKPVPGKEKRYWALLQGNVAEQFVEVPKADPVRIDGFNLELFAYKAWRDGRDKGMWYVVEATSGLSVSAPTRTKAQAIKSAKEVLLQHGAAKTERALKSRIRVHGLSPRYLSGKGK
jgi:hypothetical protein